MAKPSRMIRPIAKRRVISIQRVRAYLRYSSMLRIIWQCKEQLLMYACREKNCKEALFWKGTRDQNITLISRSTNTRSKWFDLIATGTSFIPFWIDEEGDDSASDLPFD